MSQRRESHLKEKNKKTRRVSIQAVIMTSVLLICGSMGVVATSLQYYFGKTMAQNSAHSLYEKVAKSAERDITLLDKRALTITELMAEYQEHLLPASYGLQHPALQAFSDAMSRVERVYSIYLGYENGDLLQLINLDSSQDVRQALGGKESDRWVFAVHEGSGADRLVVHYFLNEAFDVTGGPVVVGEFDSTSRPWYQQAIEQEAVTHTKPYIFKSTNSPGITYARRVQDSSVVVGVDISLSGIQELLENELHGTGSDAFIFSTKGELGLSYRSALSDSIYSISESSVASLISAEGSEHAIAVVEDAGKDYFVYLTLLDSASAVGKYFGVAVYEQRLLKPYMQQVYLAVAICAGVLLVFLFAAWLLARRMVGQVHALAEQTAKVRDRNYSDVQAVPSKIKQFYHLSQSLVDMSESIQEYERSQKALMDAIIKLIAEAIDAKSHYTAGHCERVPVLGLMLAKQAHASNQGVFEDFAFKSDDELREFEIAAWLHDCGKISVPEHVVDKGSKLEAIYNRIHEVRMRFEVLWRDAEIVRLRSSLQGSAELEKIDGELAGAREQLRQDFEFVARCNVGGEFLSDDDIQRLHDIAELTWQRNFSDRLGLSPAEEMSLEQKSLPPEGALPVQEKLLSNKEEHIVEREHTVELDPGLGINMDIPEHLYNLGELHNLSIQRGTLTAEDRFKINEHMINTIRMLERLPFTKELSNVPRYASTHHETLRGDGYPRKLGEADLSTLERILAVADIFEALTASDRPYKKGKTLSEAIRIMSFMVKDRHIDAEVFKLFLQSGVYLDYAQQFLGAEQIDEVEINAYC
jgi:HD-GYP domain-containing protein (c-di-GMP phosphodiesterase class II)